MADKQKYIEALRRICEQAKRSSPFDLDLANNSPGEQFGDDFSVERNVGGLITLRVKLDLYSKIEPTLVAVARKYLRDNTVDGYRVIEFYPK